MLAGIITDLSDWLDRTSLQMVLLVILVIAFPDSVIRRAQRDMRDHRRRRSRIGTEPPAIAAGDHAFLGDNCVT
jgi:hypothetical protein